MGDADLHRLSRIVLRNLHARRPAGPGADPRVMPGGPDYKGTPLPDHRFDCRPIRDLFSTVKLAPVRDCVKKIPAGTVLVFRIRYRSQPVLELAEARNTAGEPFEAPPACAREVLGTLPMPREIFFQSAEEKGGLECYASRLPLDSDKVLNTPWPFKRTQLNVEFPLPLVPDDDAKTSLLLQTWVLTPYFGSESGRIEARIVPDALCKACMGESNLITSGQPIPPHWPEGGTEFHSETPPPPPPEPGAALDTPPPPLE